MQISWCRTRSPAPLSFVGNNSRQESNQNVRESERLAFDEKQKLQTGLQMNKRDTNRQNDVRPNVLIILSDQLRRQAISCYGDPDARTPHIDKLAHKGVRFANSCSTYPICVPFRFTLMTGEYAHTRSIPGIEWAMSPSERTLADEFNEADYKTVYIGKWHLDGGHGRMGSGKQCGLTPVRRANQGRWQKWFGFEIRDDPFDTYYFVDTDPTPHLIEKYQTDGLFDISINYLTNEWDRSEPFCMCLSVEPPHNPFVAPDTLQRAWEARQIELPPNFEGRDQENREALILDRKRYYAMVENLDENVGRMVAFLEDQALADNTIILFVSDHGELGGSHGLTQKQWPFEESVGIPLIICDPRYANTHTSVFEDPTCTEDLFPTILGLAGLAPRNQVPGIDLSSLIRGEIQKLDRESVLLEFVSEHRQGMVFANEVWRGIRSRRFKYTVKGDKLGGTPWQFFDLDSDPFELNNLITNQECQTELIRHHGLLCEHLRQAEDPFVLLPAFGHEGINHWNKESPNKSIQANPEGTPD
ncbi:sulfatase [soil metagenome]